MSNTESSNNMNLMNLATTLEQTSALIEELSKTYAQIEPQNDASCDNVEWKEIEGHFRHLQSVMKKKLEDLEAKEKDVIEKEKFLSEREATVTAKEQDLLDRVQELKDAAVDAIVEVKVSHSVSDENAAEVRAQAVAEELTQFCERMDSKGLLNYVTENLDDTSHICRTQLPVVLHNASEPTRLVLDAVEGFFSPDETTQHGEDRDVAIHDMRQSCVLLLEALFVFLEKDDLDADSYLTHEIKERAKAIANDWKPKLALESVDAANGKSLEARAFLWLVVAFKIASEFSEEELCKCVLATAHHQQASELSRSLELSDKIPGIIETLLNNGKNIEAVNFILFFELSESYPPVPLLKTYLRDVRRKLQGNGLPETQKEFNARELTAVKAVLRCVKDYKLEDEFPLDTLKKRFIQLQNSVRDKKRNKDKYKVGRTYAHTNRGSLEPDPVVSENAVPNAYDNQSNDPNGVSENGSQDMQVCGESTQYPSTAPNEYDNQVSNQIAHAEANDRDSYDHAQDGDLTSATPYPDHVPAVDASLEPLHDPNM